VRDLTSSSYQSPSTSTRSLGSVHSAGGTAAIRTPRWRSSRRPVGPATGRSASPAPGCPRVAAAARRSAKPQMRRRSLPAAMASKKRAGPSTAASIAPSSRATRRDPG
jgi:hypothetical protein